MSKPGLPILVLSAALYSALATGVAVAVEPLPQATTTLPRYPALSYPLTDTGQVRSYGNRGEIYFPRRGSAFFGQDSQYQSRPPAWRDNGDGTVSDLNTGLMWQQGVSGKLQWKDARSGADRFRLGGYSDWRLPTIKELYSLIDFSGIDPDQGSRSAQGLRPFIDSGLFAFEYGNTARGERLIDVQLWSATTSPASLMDGLPSVFGVNFADGRIKGYPRTSRMRRDGEQNNSSRHVRYVRGNPDYGINQLQDNRDGTLTDDATGLMWMQADSGRGMNWQQALQYAEGFEFAGYSDWRLPDARELQSIVDYSRSPATTGSPAADPIFSVSDIRDESGQPDYPFYWTSTSHVSSRGASAAVYIAFGRAQGFMKIPPRSANYQLLDVHGAGAQRSDPKSGDPSRFSRGRGPQGDTVRINNYVRLVRGGVTLRTRAAQPREQSSISLSDSDRRRSAGNAAANADRPPQNRPGSGAKRSGSEQSVPAAGHFIARLDKDGDRRVSREEFDGPPDRFDFHDADADGYLSDAETPKGPPPGRRQ